MRILLLLLLVVLLVRVPILRVLIVLRIFIIRILTLVLNLILIPIITLIRIRVPDHAPAPIPKTILMVVRDRIRILIIPLVHRFTLMRVGRIYMRNLLCNPNPFVPSKNLELSFSFRF